tara:strand:+ start:2775 stop:5699 length:2925 start_codon:yes stop_codon:yes gene_type:complete
MALIAHYKLDGDAKDSIGDNHGTVVGGVNWVDGKIGQAAGLSGQTGIFLGELTGLQPFAVFSIAGWVKFNGTGASSTDTLVSVSTSYSSTTFAVDFYSSMFRFFTYAEGGGSSLVTTPEYPQNEWFHFAAVHTGTHNLLYVNGALKGSVVAARPRLDISSTWIGSRGAERVLLGDIQDVRIYDHALSEREVRDLSQATILDLRPDSFIEPTVNVIQNTNLDTGWSKGYCADIRWNDIDPPEGVESQVVSFIDSDNQIGYWYSYGDYAPQLPGQTYTASLYVKTVDPNFQIRFYTADNSETGRYSSSYITVPNDGKWHRIIWPSFTNPSDSQSDSLSFRFSFGAPQGEGQRTWFCAPQLEPKDHATDFVVGERIGLITDSSTQGYDLVPDLDTSPSLSKDLKKSFHFNGEQKLVKQIGINGDPEEITVSFIAKSETISSYQGFLELKGVGGHENGLVITASGNNSLRVRYWSDEGTNLTWVPSSKLFSVGTQITLTIKNKRIKVYENGVNVIDHTYTNPLNLTGEVQFGLYSWNNNYLIDGNIKDINVFSTALKEPEIKELYQTKASIDSNGSVIVSNLKEMDNLVVNPNFEGSVVGEIPEGWSAESGSMYVVDDESYKGSKSLYFPGDGTYNRIRSERFSVKPGEKIYGRCVTKSESGAKFYFGLVFYGAGYSYFSHPEPTEWMETYDSYITIPEGAYEASVWLFNYRDNSGACWVDDVYVTRNGPIPDGFSKHEILPKTVPGINELGVNSPAFSELGPTKNIVAWYPLTNDTKDLLGDNHGTNNGVTFNADGGVFNGSSNFTAKTPEEIKQDPQLWTVSAWVMTSDVSRTNQKVNNYNRGNTFVYSSTTKSLLYLNGGENDHYVYGAPNQNNVWKHIVFVFDQSQMLVQIYTDGQLTATSGNVDSTDTPSGILETTTFGSNLIGGMRDIRIYNRALSSEEIATLYKLTVQGGSKVLISKDCLYTRGQIKEVIA